MPPLAFLPPESPPAFVTLNKSTFSLAEALLGDMTQSKIRHLFYFILFYFILFYSILL